MINAALSILDTPSSKPETIRETRVSRRLQGRRDSTISFSFTIDQYDTRRYTTAYRGPSITLRKTTMAPPTTTTIPDHKADHGRFCQLHKVKTRVRTSSQITERFDLEAWYRRFYACDGMPERIDLVYQCKDTCTYHFLCCDLDLARESFNALTTEELLRRLFVRYLNHRKNRSCDCALTTYCRGVVPEPRPSDTHPPVKINTAALQQFLLSPEPKCPTTPAKADGPSKHTKPPESANDFKARSDDPPKYTELPEGSRGTSLGTRIIRQVFSWRSEQQGRL